MVMGLPLHPLVVHAVVVFVPAFLLGMLAIMVVPRWRPRFGWLVAAIGVVGAIAAIVAKYAGGALAHALGDVPMRHAVVGTYVMYAAVIAGLLGFAWKVLEGRPPAAKVATVVGWLAVVAAAVATACTLIAGHSGAQAVWEKRVDPSAGAGSPGVTSTPQAGASARAYTKADVAAHATAEDCWTIIDGGVYDLTAWVKEHPGGEKAIRATCGKDATTMFTSIHGGKEKIAKKLHTFAVGTLAPQ